MKEILAIIRINKINQTKQALADVGIPSFTATGKVLGRGKGTVDYRILHGAEKGHAEAIALLGQGPKLVPKRLLSIVVPDSKVQITVDAIIKTNQTGNAGDGKIFVLPVSDSISVRTGQAGDEVLD